MESFLESQGGRSLFARMIAKVAIHSRDAVQPQKCTGIGRQEDRILASGGNAKVTRDFQAGLSCMKTRDRIDGLDCP